MRRLLSIAIASLVFIAAPQSRTRAGLDPDAPLPASGNVALIVMEADGCIYCSIFRRDVLPAYETSERGKAVPVRFLDINDIDGSGIELSSPVSILPTFVVTRNNREVGRIPGYVGPENFFHAMNYLLASTR